MMTTPSVVSCYIVGEGSLAVRCAMALVERGHEVRGIATSEPAVIDWASGEGIEVVSPDADLVAWMSAAPFDYLFSIVNLRVLPDALIALPQQHAINFHDGPLPGYAGLNTPSWALLDGAESYGVTWHEMTAEVDAGRIVEKEAFDVAEGETAFSLNARCFDAGIASFTRLADALATGLTLDPQPQGERRYFGRFARVDGDSLLRFDTDADTLARFVRAHDYGAGYANAFGIAKTQLGARWFAVGSARVLDAASGEAPGTVVALADGSEDLPEGSLRVATAGDDVVLADLRCPSGLPVDSATLRAWDVVPGAQLEGPTDDIAALVDASARPTYRALRRFSALVAAELPRGAAAGSDESAGSDAPSTRLAHTVDVPSAYAARAADVVLAFVSRWGDADGCDVGVRDAAQHARVADQAVFGDRVPVRVAFDPSASVDDALDSARDARASALDRLAPYSLDVFLREPRLGSLTRDAAGLVLPVEVRIGLADAPTSAAVCVDVSGGATTWSFCPNQVSERAAASIARQFGEWSSQLDGATQIGASSVVSADERRKLLETLNGPAADWPESDTVHGEFAARAAAQPDAPALSFRDATLSYAELDARSNQVAHALIGSGVAPGALVGLCLRRSAEMVVAAMGVLKAGCAYVPLDPAYPAERIAYMVDDSGVAAVVTDAASAARLPSGGFSRLFVDAPEVANAPTDAVNVDVSPSDLAYVIYTSGSTGNPKGVMVEHRNVVSFFVGMDARVGTDPGVWLAVTSMNFDISVLEIFWTLSRGFHVVVQADDHGPGLQNAGKKIDFGLFYFSSDESEGLDDKYELLLTGARFGDANGFSSVWTPERHFHAFGGLFPNPSVTSAALATITENVDLRAGSCVTPLHSPIRVAEEWSVVDNLSKGRVGLSVASGWQPNDFAIRPGGFENRQEQIFDDIETLRALWRGESRPFTNGVGETVDIRILPRPVSKELPIWVTAAGNPATFERAGRVGANLLTHLLGQTFDELGEKIALYRRAREEAGHEGRGTVSLMLHTYIGTSSEQAKDTVREPMKAYLRSAVGLVKAAAWSFPTFKKTTTMEDGSFGIDHLSDEDMDALLEHSFERYYETAGLFGTVDDAVAQVDRIKGLDVDEIPCLIDFGVPTPTVVEALPRLAEVLHKSNEAPADVSDWDTSVAGEIAARAVTHFQCTPSQMSLLLAESATRDGLSTLRRVLVGGEALPAPMARDLEKLVGGDVINMYGPTETTIWSATAPVKDIADSVSIGTPIPNTRIVLLDAHGGLVPPGEIGELCIGGPGVVRGYLGRDALTAERFIADPNVSGERLYRTGDLARWQDDGTLAFHGRVDHQVKLRGYRIEMGEIEARMAEFAGVRRAAAVVREDTPGDKRLVGYVEAAPGFDVGPLRAALATALPDYMVPSILVVLPRMPETPNRKVDRNALPAPQRGGAAGKSDAFVAPADGLEKTIADIWCDVLGVDEVGTRDNFFDIGGHSLLTIQVHDRLRNVVDKPLSLVDLFRYPTVSTLVRFIEGGDDSKKVLAKTRERAQSRREAMARRRGTRRR